MQNKYVADIGDFGKYGLLNYICNPSNACSEKLSLGVNWYLVKDENGNNDGKFIEYLNKDNIKNVKEFRACSPALYDELRNIVLEEKRSVSEIQKRNILPSDTVFYDNYLCFGDFDYNDSGSTLKRKKIRKKWAEEGFEKLQNRDIIFFDPDNGLEVSSYKRTSAKGTKFVYYDEIIDYYNSGQSLIIYNHRDRSSEEVYLSKIMNIGKYVNADDMFYMRFNRYSVRDYIFVLHRNHSNIINAKIEEMMQSGWKKHFKKILVT